MERLPNYADWLNGMASCILIDNPGSESAYEEARLIIEKLDSVIFHANPPIGIEQRES